MGHERLAVYTTVYPGVEQYLAQWYQSVLTQTDNDFDVWVGVDSLDTDTVISAMSASPGAINFITAKHCSPAEIRQHALSLLGNEYPSLVLVDSDDLLFPTRVEAARKALDRCEVSGCALRIIDNEGTELGITFGETRGEDLSELLPRYNIYGLSNTAYRSDLLRRCLPLPTGCELVDWLLATRAWSEGARFIFDEQPRMSYRQYPANVARVVLPFSAEQVREATRRVITHYRCALGGERPINGSCGASLRQAFERAIQFQQAISHSEILEAYVDRLNQLTPRYVWWWCVAHPELEYLWRN